MLRSITLFMPALVMAAKKVEAPPEPAFPGMLVDYLFGLASPVGNAAMGLATDIASLALAAPAFGVDVFVWSVGLIRQFPGTVKNVYNADDATLNKMTDFCVYASGVIFVTYASLTALNLALGVAVRVKNYFQDDMVLPDKVLGQALPSPLLEARNIIQKQVLDRIRSFSVNAWIIPLEGQSGAPSIASAVPVLSSVISACMILSCAPALHNLMKNGADKGAAEALAYTMGTALGIQYLAKKI